MKKSGKPLSKALNQGSRLKKKRKKKRNHTEDGNEWYKGNEELKCTYNWTNFTSEVYIRQ